MKKHIETCLSSVIICEQSRKPFKIQPRELAFHIDHSLPIPTLHPTIRHGLRASKSCARYIHEQSCARCHANIYTTHSADQVRSLYCEECYRQEVY